MWYKEWTTYLMEKSPLLFDPKLAIEAKLMKLGSSLQARMVLDDLQGSQSRNEIRKNFCEMLQLPSSSFSKMASLPLTRLRLAYIYLYRRGVMPCPLHTRWRANWSKYVAEPLVWKVVFDLWRMRVLCHFLSAEM